MGLDQYRYWTPFYLLSDPIQSLCNVIADPFGILVGKVTDKSPNKATAQICR